MAAVKEIVKESKTRRRKTGVFLAASPLLRVHLSSDETGNVSKHDVVVPENNRSETEEHIIRDIAPVGCEVDSSTEDSGDETTVKAIPGDEKGSNRSRRGDLSSAQKQQTQKQRRVRIRTEVESVITDDRPQTVKSDSTRSGHATKGLYDAKSEKSVSYMTAGGKTMKTSTLYQESTKGNDDVLQVRSKLRQLQINYSKTNATLNDRVIMCDILRVTHNQVIPRIKLIHAMERRLYNHRQHSRLRIAINGKKSKELAKTVAEMKKEREERIKQKQSIPRKVETLKTFTVEDMEKLRNCRYLRVNQRQEFEDFNLS